MNEEMKKFCDLFRCEHGPGKRYYKRLPMQWSPQDTIVDLQTHEETGVRLELAVSDFERLMAAATEGLAHQRYREMNPAARALYEEYMVMFLLTHQYNK
jgi:hypothetical protein